MKNLKKYSDYILSGKIERQEGIEYLKNQNELSNEDRLLIYSYCYPRHILDRELPLHIQNFRKKCGNSGSGWLQPNFREACILVEAFRTLQYGRFIRHLMHAFLDTDKLSSCSGIGEDHCPICGKKIVYVDSWDSEKDKDSETLAIMSSESSVCLCKDCLIQLYTSKGLIDENFEPGFLDKPKYQKLV